MKWSFLLVISAAAVPFCRSLFLPCHGKKNSACCYSRSMPFLFLDYRHHSRECHDPSLLRKASPRDDYEEYNDDEDDDDDDPPDVDINNFTPPTASFGLGRGRSSPAQRKAMGRAGSSIAHVYVCTSCGGESVKWMGKCPTCREWNTLQEHVVQRDTTSTAFAGGASIRPMFGGGGGGGGGGAVPKPASWLDGVLSGQSGNPAVGNTPVRITDLYQEINDNHGESSSTNTRRRQRIWIPNDPELNLVLGGGIMQGSITLIGGDPGVGKSTLLLQTAASVASMVAPTPGIGMGMLSESSSSNNNSTNASDMNMGPVWYVSGEENPQQIASRAHRLNIEASELWLLSETHVDSLCEQVVSYCYADNTKEGDPSVPLLQKPPSLLVIDSIQTMVCNAGGASAAGGITQVRESVATFLRLAKSTGIPIMLVGHVTKSGDVAGPRTVEHMVDCVLYLEGMSSGSGTTASAATTSHLRMLRASKNRFGSAEEVGVYEMTAGRLLPVTDPSSMFLTHRRSTEDVQGSAIAVIMEGRRAMTMEIQALVVPASANAGYGRRTVDGISLSRLSLLMGVLQKRGGIMLGRQDVYVNVVGRIRLDRGQDNNLGDLAVAVALVSSLTSIPVRSDTAFFGAVDLSGDLRPADDIERRLKEAWRMGFSRVVSGRVIGTKGEKRSQTSPVRGVEWIQCTTLKEAINAGLVRDLPKRRMRRTKEDSDDESEAPGRLEDLGLEIMDDHDDFE